MCETCRSLHGASIDHADEGKVGSMPRGVFETSQSLKAGQSEAGVWVDVSRINSLLEFVARIEIAENCYRC